MFTRIILLIVASTFAISCSAHARQEINTVGKGSYTTARPEFCQALPEAIYKVDSLDGPTPTGPTPTNQWWSSLVWEEFSNNMFPHPLGVVACEQGLSVSYPGAAIVAADNAIMGGGVSADGDIVIGLDGVEFDDARLADFSDWFVTAKFSSKSGNLKTTFGHGSPFVFCDHDAGRVRLNLAEKPQIWSGNENSSVLGITVRGNHYGLFASSGSAWSSEDAKRIVLTSDDRDFCLALLPDAELETLETFTKCADFRISGTDFDFRIADGFLKTTLKVECENKTLRGDAQTVFALYPHQWKYLEGDLSNSSYQSVRGEMKLVVGDSFTTKVPIQGVLPILPPDGIPDRERMLEYLDAEATKDAADFGDTYWEGKHLGKLSSLSGICEAMGETERQQFFIAELKRRLKNWLTAEKDQAAPLFYYNRQWGTLIGSRPSYGSDAEINDHHFHYGYFIRAAAEVARFDPQWAKQWGPMVNLLIGDIASQRATEMFPKLRGFDVYAGHSWASGHARFGDGNNQESSSESMNAWYGTMLWGEATGDPKIRDLGAFLFNTELTALEEYWLDVSGTNFPKAYPNLAVGMVWGGKGAFATWFSGDIDHIHGINWLPFTPASVYLGRHPQYVKSNYQAVIENREHGDDLNKGWGDLSVMFGALADSKPAVAFMDAHPNCNIEGGNSHAFMYHWIHTADRLGASDRSVTADYLFADSFVRDGSRSYYAYNFRDEPLKVTFSDGTTLESRKKGLFSAKGVSAEN